MLPRLVAVGLALLFSTPVFSEITINAASTTHWKIADGALSLDWNPASGSVFGIYLTGYPDNLVDPSRRGKNGPASGPLHGQHRRQLWKWRAILRLPASP